MSETQTTKRLKQVAVEFNVGISTVVDYLSSKGYDIENKPTTKVPEEAYVALLEKFQPDKLTKEKSDNLKLTPLIHKEEKEKAAEQKKEAEAAAAAPPKEKPVEKAAEKPAEAPTPAEEPKESPAAPVEGPAKIVAEEKPAKESAPQPPAEEESSGLKVVGKIDLESFKRHKKGHQAQARPEKPKEKEKPAPAAEIQETEQPVAKTEEKQPEAPAPVAEAPEELEEVRMADEDVKLLVDRTVSLLEAKDEPKEDASSDSTNRLRARDEERKGLTIVGKIDLQQFDKPKKKPLASTDDLSTIKKKRRKRKRIGEGEQGPAGGNRPPQQGQGQGQGPGGNRPQGGGYQGGNRGGGPGANRPQGGGPARSNAPKTEKDREQDDKRIQEEIKKTLNRLTQKGSNEGKTRIKKRKKEERRHQRQMEEEEAIATSKVIQVTEFITANEMASLMDVQVNQVIMACMSLGLMVSINQRLDAETITVVADEFGYEVLFKDAEMEEPTLEEEDDADEMVERAPIVTIMGHVDHGKTSLLDHIRSSNIIAGEAGGITQHIGAYEVTLESGRKIAFLDTPGHEAFTAMRARGAKVTDVAIIVIAADDSVMPQTKEAISHAQAAGVPIVFAFNKIDKDGANADRIREQLAELNILVEEWGGKFQTQEISAKKGLNIDLLLEKVLLESDVLELKADPGKRAVGTVIEASLDKGKGNVATILVEKGTLRVGDPILAGANYGRVKALFNERGGKVESVGPATPVQVLGFDGAPTSGDKFYVTENEQLAKEVATKRKQLVREQGIRTRKHITLDEIGRRLAIGNFKELNLIIKGDVDGSVEALSDSLQKLSTEEVQVNVIFKGVGQISESDVLLALASDAIIIGFQVRPSVSARKLAENEQIDIRLYSVIYDAIEEVKAAMEGLLAPTHEEKIVCNIEIRETFRITKVGTIAGCYVLDGKVNRNTSIRIVRDGVVVYTGELASLKRFKDDVKEVSAGYECGLNIHNFNDIKVGDIIEGYEEIQVARKL